MVNKVLLSFCFSLVLLFISSRTLLAGEASFVTLVNPVRLSKYNPSPGESIKAQYNILSEYDLPATWLLTYDALHNEEVKSAIALFNANQELGLFLEVTPDFAQKAGVDYNDTGSWHHATSVFLSGYTQEDRIKLIDTIFSSYKEQFEVYPQSVGAWWVDAFSLSYMKQKYGITSNLGVADQFSTDGYQVWGQYWSVPFLPSLKHAGIPAKSSSDALGVVTIQWAPRDPINGYKSSLYSTQDYAISAVGLDTSYFEKLLQLYTDKKSNNFAHITLGLESDLLPSAYVGEYKKQMQLVADYKKQQIVQVLNMDSFSKWYMESFPSTPGHFIETADLLSKSQRVFWYQSAFYRIGLLYDEETKQTKAFDLRSYSTNFVEPYNQIPNKEFQLSIYIPSLIDETVLQDSGWGLDLGEYLNSHQTELETKIIFNKGEIVLSDSKILIRAENVQSPSIFPKYIEVKRSIDTTELVFTREWVGQDGYLFQDLTMEATSQVRSKKFILLVFSVLIVLAISMIILYKTKFRLFSLIMFICVVVAAWRYYHGNSQTYFVSQSEVDALLHLANLPYGRVVVFDQQCLQCDWQSEHLPAAYGNKRDYVAKLGEKQIIYDQKTFKLTDVNQVKEHFATLNADYIYLVSYQDYIETLPVSPGDLNIEKVYDNANAELWKVKN